jgi:dolichyl-diphosphooligosaccharide--protein glycosyltransferase
VFALLQAVALLKYLQTFLNKSEFKYLFLAGLFAAGAVFLAVVGLTWGGVVAPWSGRFYSLWDTGYAKIHIPIIASVSEHQPTTWFSFFFDLHILACVFPAGLWYCIKNINDERVFIVLYAISAVYFAGVMVRLMLTLTPCVCILAAIAFSKLFDLYLREEDSRGGEGAEGASTAVETGDKNGRLYDKVNLV